MSDKVEDNVSVTRVTNAELLAVSDTYIDFYDYTRFGKRHRFAFIKPKKILHPHELTLLLDNKQDFIELLKLLHKALYNNERVNLIIVKRKNNKGQYEDYLLKAEYTHRN